MRSRRHFLKTAATGFAWSGFLWLPKAQQVSAFPRRKIPTAAASCATSDTSIAHDELLEGFQSSGTNGYENTWAETGTTANIDSYADSSSLTTGKPTGACNRAWKVTTASDGTETYAKWTRSSPIALASNDVDITVFFLVESIPATGKTLNIFSCLGSYDDFTGTIQLLNNSGSCYCRFQCSVSSDYYTGLSTNTWHRADIHFDTTAADCTFNIDSGTPKSFTRYTSAWRNELKYIAIGTFNNLAAGDADGLNLWIDLLCINTP